jgi:hypothetical protein
MKVIRLVKLSIWLTIVLAGAIPVQSAYCASPGVSKAPGSTTAGKQNKTPSGPSSFRPDMTFGQAIEILRHSTKPALNISVLWKDLELNADITKDTPIGINGVSGVSVRTHLKLLLEVLSAGSPAKLGYVLDDGVIIIATNNSLHSRLRMQVYYIGDLVAGGRL